MTQTRGDPGRDDTFPLVAAYLKRQEVEEAIKLLHERRAQWIARAIYLASGESIQPADVEAAYSACLIALARRFAEPTFTHPNLCAYVWKVAWSKGKEWLRSQVRAARNRVVELTEETTSGAAQDADGAILQWCELLALLNSRLAKLPKRQRLIARVWLEHASEFWDGENYARLAELVGAVSGQLENPNAVRGSWQAARKKLRAFLRRLGYRREG